MPRLSQNDLMEELQRLRARLEPVFAPDTAFPGSKLGIRSAGHCAVVAAIVQESLGGALLSAEVDHEQHWFNRIETTAGVVDVDLTGDQFGLPPLQIAPSGKLYRGAVAKDLTDLLPEAIERANRLCLRAGFTRAAGRFRV